MDLKWYNDGHEITNNEIEILKRTQVFKRLDTTPQGLFDELAKLQPDLADSITDIRRDVMDFKRFHVIYASLEARRAASSRGFALGDAHIPPMDGDMMGFIPYVSPSLGEKGISTLLAPYGVVTSGSFRLLRNGRTRTDGYDFTIKLNDGKWMPSQLNYKGDKMMIYGKMARFQCEKCLKYGHTKKHCKDRNNSVRQPEPLPIVPTQVRKKMISQMKTGANVNGNFGGDQETRVAVRVGNGNDKSLMCDQETRVVEREGMEMEDKDVKQVKPKDEVLVNEDLISKKKVEKDVKKTNPKDKVMETEVLKSKNKDEIQEQDEDKKHEVIKEKEVTEIVQIQKSNDVKKVEEKRTVEIQEVNKYDPNDMTNCKFPPNTDKWYEESRRRQMIRRLEEKLKLQPDERMAQKVKNLKACCDGKMYYCPTRMEWLEIT